MVIADLNREPQPLLIVSQDLLFRESLGRAIGQDGHFQVIGSAATLKDLMKTKRVSPRTTILIDGNKFNEDDSRLFPGLISMNLKIVILDTLGGKPYPATIRLPREISIEGLLKQLSDPKIAGSMVLEPATPYQATEILEPRPRKRGLTTREFGVAFLIGRGQSNRQIADQLNVHEQSIKNVVSVILRKCDCVNRVQLAILFRTQPDYLDRLKPVVSNPDSAALPIKKS